MSDWIQFLQLNPRQKKQEKSLLVVSLLVVSTVNQTSGINKK